MRCEKYARGIDLMFLFAQSHPDGGFFLCNTPTPPFPIPIPILTMPCDAVVVFVLSFKNLYRSLYLGGNKRFPPRTDCGSLGNPAAKKIPIHYPLDAPGRVRRGSHESSLSSGTARRAYIVRS